MLSYVLYFQNQTESGLSERFEMYWNTKQTNTKTVNKYAESFKIFEIFKTEVQCTK